jgi:DNA-binding transcriptional LysR family regulator
MMKTAPGWEFYRSFLAVVRDGSLSRAARALTLTQPTLGRHIDALEAALDLPLFTRSQHGLTPTQAALALIPHAEAMANAAEALLRAASGAAEAELGTVRLTASDIVGGELLPPILARFQENHPGIILELALSNRTEDLLRRDADIAVRMVRPVQAALIARRLGTVPLHLYAHRRYIARCGMPDSLAALAGHTLIGFDRDDSATRGIAVAGLTVTRELFGFRCDNDLAQVAAMRAGLGILACQDLIAGRDPDLVPVLADELSFELEMWLAMHEDLRASRRVRLLYDHLAEELTGLLAR